MEDDAGGMVRRLALKTRFSEMGWGSTPPSSAKTTGYIVNLVDGGAWNSEAAGSNPATQTKLSYGVTSVEVRTLVCETGSTGSFPV